MSLLDKLDAVAATRKALLPEGIDVFGTPIEEVYSSTEAKELADRRILFLGTNNYLGLTFAPECLAQRTQQSIARAQVRQVHAWPTVATVDTAL